MSDALGSENLSGSDSTSAIRQSFGNPNPISVPSFENDRKTIRPIRNFTRPRTNASLLRGSVLANARTSSIVTGKSAIRIRVAVPTLTTVVAQTSQPAVALRPRAFVRVSGPDAEDYLQRMVSNDVEALSAGDACDALLLTPKARL